MHCPVSFILWIKFCKIFTKNKYTQNKSMIPCPDPCPLGSDPNIEKSYLNSPHAYKVQIEFNGETSTAAVNMLHISETSTT